MRTTQTSSPTRLRQWRTDSGLTLAEVSDLTGLAAPVLSRVERGLAGLRPMTKVRIARALGVAVRDLFELEKIEASEAEL